MADLTIPREQITLSAIQYVNTLPVDEKGLIVMPGYAKPISRAAAMSRAIRDIVAELSDRSASNQLIDRLTGPDTKHFSGKLLRVEREERSKRGVLTLETGTEREAKDWRTKDPLPAGQEQVRTERYDGEAGKGLVLEAKSLEGHRVLLTVFLEAMSNGTGKVRVLQDLRDLGQAS